MPPLVHCGTIRANRGWFKSSLEVMWESPNLRNDLREVIILRKGAGGRNPQLWNYIKLCAAKAPRTNVVALRMAATSIVISMLEVLKVNIDFSFKDSRSTWILTKWKSRIRGRPGHAVPMVWTHSHGFVGSVLANIDLWHHSCVMKRRWSCSAPNTQCGVENFANPPPLLNIQSGVQNFTPQDNRNADLTYNEISPTSWQVPSLA